MKSILITLVLAGVVHAQYVPQLVPVQCGPGGCCQPQYFYGQPCQPRRPAPQQSRPEPDGIQTQPAPQFQPLPSPPPVQTPATPGPTIDPQSLKDQQAAIIKEIHDSQTTIEKSLVVIRDKAGCQCDNTKLEAAITTLVQTNQTLVVAINELKNAKQSEPAPVASGAPVSYDIRPHRSK